MEKIAQESLDPDLTRLFITNVRENQDLPELSVIIPAYNEEKTIRHLVNSIRKITNSFGIQCEIIIVNDGSTDLTRIEAEATNERVIDVRNNGGKGKALRKGFQVSRGNNILTIDADGSHQAADIKNLIECYFTSKTHMLIGSRFMKKPKTRFTSPTNIVGNKIFSYILFLISGEYITDTQSGLRIFPRRLIENFEFDSKGYEIESELTAKAIAFGYEIREQPINCEPRIYGSSSLNSLRDGMRILRCILNSYLNGKKIRKK